MSDNIRSVEKVLKQKAVYWEVDSLDDNAKPVYKQPVEIKCRWEEVAEQYIDDDGHDQVSNSVVMVDRDLSKQGVLWLGELPDVEDQFSPLQNDGAYEIKKFAKIPDKKGKKFFRRAYL